MSKFKIGDLVFVNAGPYAGYFGEITNTQVKSALYNVLILDDDGHQLECKEIEENYLESATENSAPNRANYSQINGVEI